MTKKQAFRTEVKQFMVEYFERTFDSLSHKERSLGMTRFYIEKILRPLAPNLIPEDTEDLEECYVDGAHDQNVDFLCRTEGYVLIVQAKYHSPKKKEKRHEFWDFCDVLFRLHPKWGVEYKKNQKLLDAASGIDWINDSFNLHYITMTKATDDIRTREQEGHRVAPKMPDLPERVEIQFCDETDLNKYLREALSAAEGIVGDVPVRFTPIQNNTPWVIFENPENRKSYIGLINAAQLRELYKQYKYRLFALNIRNYVGETSTNKGIKETAYDEPDNFFFFNNGISAVATEIVPDDKESILRCNRFSVINGAQTVRSLWKACSQNPERVGKAQLMIRISEINLGKDNRSNFLENITRFNNTQNNIKISDFRSNDTVQVNLSKRFSKISREGRKFWFKNKRTGSRDPKKIIIGMEDFAKTIFSFRYGPPDMHGGVKYVFDSSANGGYVKLFGDSNQVWTTLTDDSFDLLAGTWFVCETVRHFLRQEKVRRIELENKLIKDKNSKYIPIVKNAIQQRWLVFFTVGKILRHKYEEQELELNSDLQKLSKPTWTTGESTTRKTLMDYTQDACEIIIRVYRTAFNDPSFTFRNWVRNRETLSEIDYEIINSSSIERLPLLRQ